MRVSKQQSSGARGFFAMAMAAALCATAWSPVMAQDDVEPQVPTEAAEAPTPPEAPEVRVKEREQQIRILRQEDGTLKIHTRSNDGENARIEVDLGEDFGGEVTRRIYEKLEQKGILDEKGLVIEEALESVPRNIDIGIAAHVAREQREHARVAREMAREARQASHEFEFRSTGARKGDDDMNMEWLIAVVSVLAVFGSPVLIVWLVTRNSYRKKQLLVDNVNRLVSEGRDIPPELLDALDSERPSKARDRGFTLIAVGAAVFIWLTAVADIGVGSLGLIPLFIGVARYINWKLDNQQQAG